LTALADDIRKELAKEKYFDEYKWNSCLAYKTVL
jgi:hypothetical protein